MTTHNNTTLVGTPEYVETASNTVHPEMKAKESQGESTQYTVSDDAYVTYLVSTSDTDVSAQLPGDLPHSCSLLLASDFNFRLKQRISYTRGESFLEHTTYTPPVLAAFPTYAPEMPALMYVSDSEEEA
ncbi:hypothetical protein DFH09DRAFT_1328501 [Mycena vulgaris]|nr:hypothetical protein DFH09DRAFT_1328501 [Mycena vulgaris]